MSASDRVFSVVEQIREHAGVDMVYGDPIEHEGRTVVPVARVAYGFGGGYGSGPANGEADEVDGESDERARDDDRGESEGVGFGGGVRASPVGALEITDDGTRFVRYRDARTLAVVAGVFLVLGYLLGRK